MKIQGYGMEYASARATPELVGREEILDKITKAIQSKRGRTQVIYITAGGGMGKTRLLEEVVKRWRGGGKKKPKLLVVNRLIDLYHTHTHTEEGLIAELVEVLDPEGKSFPRYIQKLAELAHVKFTMGETQPIQGLRREMLDTFIEELNELGEIYDKVMLVFDTAEVLTFETDRVQRAMGLSEKSIGVTRWLIQELLNRFHNGVVLLAGRPETPQLLNELKKSSAEVEEYALPSFSERETLEYFAVVTQATREENPQSAKRIESIPEETRKKFHYLTGGQPFVLALLIDYLAITNEIPALTDRHPDIFPGVLRDLIVEVIQQGWRSMDQVIEALSWTPKGMGAELMAWVLNNHRPTDEDVKLAQENILALREPKKRLSFVKIRAADDLVFLQDEMYMLMNRAKRTPQGKRILDDILAFYEWKIRQTRRKIADMESPFQVTGGIPAEKITQIGRKGINPEAERMHKARARLQAYQVEQVYYTLQADALKGFELYSKYAEESFQSSDTNLWLLLHDELLRFTKRKDNLSAKGLSLQAVEADMGIRWIQTSIADENYGEAQKQLERFRETGSDLLLSDSYYDLNLKILEMWILAYTGKDQERARQLTVEVLGSVDKLPSETELDRWHIRFLKAYAISMQGFLIRRQGEFEKAVEKYREAVPLWRELDLKLEASNNLNNLAYAEMEVGDFKAALGHCNDALNMRREIGRQKLVGLSLNTLGLIETRAGSPERGRFRCERALAIFREMEFPGGIGLACWAYAEALRRMTNTGLLPYEQEIEHLKEASRYADEAVEIFTNQVKSPLSLAESYIELGCVYREWTRHLPSNTSEQMRMVEKSQEAYETATTIAEQGGYDYRAIDALVNMAWLYYYAGDTKTAEDVLRRRVRDRLGYKHLYTTSHGVDRTNAPASWNWVQLGKANVLLGNMHYDGYKQADSERNRVKAEERLRQAAHNWTLAMAYNSLYSTSSRDFTKGQDEVYERLRHLDHEEMNWVRDSMDRTHVEYHIDEEQRAFQQFLDERFGVSS
jgi:tetratricopeptide (TPR) repeat protein